MRALERANPALAGLTEASEELAFSSRADSTVKRYLSVAERFVSDCVAMGLDPPYLPAAPATVAAYLTRLQRVASPAAPTVGVVLAAIRWVHVVKGWVNPCNDPVVMAVADGMRRAAHATTDQPLPLLPAQLQTVLVTLRLAVHRTNTQVAAMLALSYPAMLRFSEVHALL